MNHKTKDSPWTMPKWMKRFVKYIGNTGGNSVDDLMTRPPATVQVNAPLALIQCAVGSQVDMLRRMHAAGELQKVDPNAMASLLIDMVGSKHGSGNCSWCHTFLIIDEPTRDRIQKMLAQLKGERDAENTLRS